MSFFKEKKPAILSDGDKLRLALEICQAEIDYCEAVIRDEIRQTAINTNNYTNSVTSALNSFNEASFMAATWPYLVKPATAELYAKRDVFLDLQAILVGDTKNPVKDPAKSVTIGGKSQISNTGLSYSRITCMDNLISRSKDDTTKLKDKVTKLKKSRVIDKEIISDRFLKANKYIEDKVAIIDKVRDTQEIDGMFMGAIKALVRLFTQNSKSTENRIELQKYIAR